jgi:putative membrane protein
LAAAQDDSKVGKLEPAEFKKINSEAGAKVKALKTDDKAVSDSDKQLVEEIALGGMLQLEASELALKKTRSADVRLIAEAEVEEQKGLAAKLKEFAAATGIKLPDALKDRGKKLMGDLKEAKSMDRSYLEECGIKGHEALKKTMTKVKKEAEDPMLKALAEAALPLIEVHLTVAKDEMKTLG